MKKRNIYKRWFKPLLSIAIFLLGLGTFLIIQGMTSPANGVFEDITSTKVIKMTQAEVDALQDEEDTHNALTESVDDDINLIDSIDSLADADFDTEVTYTIDPEVTAAVIGDLNSIIESINTATGLEIAPLDVTIRLAVAPVTINAYHDYSWGTVSDIVKNTDVNSVFGLRKEIQNINPGLGSEDRTVINVDKDIVGKDGTVYVTVGQDYSDQLQLVLNLTNTVLAATIVYSIAFATGVGAAAMYVLSKKTSQN